MFEKLKCLLVDLLGTIVAFLPEKKIPYRLRNRIFMHQLKRRDLVSWRVNMAKQMGVTVGSGCQFYSLGFYSEPFLVEIGNDVIVSGDVKFITHDGAVFLAKDKIENVRGHYGRIKVGNNCFIGMNAIILPNVEIGDNCIIGAGAVVANSIPQNSVVFGNPAKIIFKTSLYLKMKIFSKNTIRCSDYPFPCAIPADVRRSLLVDQVPSIPKKIKIGL